MTEETQQIAGLPHAQVTSNDLIIEGSHIVVRTLKGHTAQVMPSPVSPGKLLAQFDSHELPPHYWKSWNEFPEDAFTIDPDSQKLYDDMKAARIKPQT